MFRARYADVYHGDERWRAIEVTGGDTYAWPAGSTYIANPPYFDGMTMTPGAARPTSTARGRWPCSAIRSPPTTSRPAGAIKLDSPAGKYLIDNGVPRPSSTAMARAAAITR